jgi:hypothetical protein
MDETTYEDDQGLSKAAGIRGTSRREFVAALEEKMSSTTSIDIDRDIGNFFYDLKPARDAGVGLTEQTIDYIADVKGEPEWIRAFRKNAYRVFKSKPLLWVVALSARDTITRWILSHSLTMNAFWAFRTGLMIASPYRLGCLKPTREVRTLSYRSL